MSTIASSLFLRRALAADAVASGAVGVLLAFGGESLAGLTGLAPALTMPVGAFLIGYAALVGLLASRPALPSLPVWVVILGNVAWTIESVLLLVLGWAEPTGLGVAFVIAQAVAVGLFAELQFMGLRRSARLAAA